MPRYIVKLTDKDNNDFYMEWSTIVDAPVTYGMSLDEFKGWYQDEFGRDGMERLADRLARVEETGCSSQGGMTAEEVISCNRAGPNESELTLDEIVHWYCHERKEPR